MSDPQSPPSDRDDTRRLDFLSRPFLDSFGVGLLLLDCEGRVIDANKGAGDVLGLTHEQLLTLNPFDEEWRAVRRDGTPLPNEEFPVRVTLGTGESCTDVTLGVEVHGRGQRWLKVTTHSLTLSDGSRGVSVRLADVTREVGLEDELRTANEHLRIVAQYPADVVILASKDAVSEWVSDSVTEYFGWEPHEVIGVRIDAFVHPEDLARITNYRRDAPDATTANFTVRFRTKSGEYRWIAISARRFDDELTHTSRIISSWRDVQAVVEAQEALAASENRFRFIAENSSDLVAELDQNQIVTWVSPSVREILGFSVEETVGRPALEFLEPEDRAHVGLALTQVLGEFEARNVRARMVTADGGFRWMIGRARAKFDDDHHRDSITVSLRDIHNEEVMRQQLKESEARYRLLAEYGADLVILLDAQGVIEWVSPSATALFGWPPEEMIGRRPIDFVEPEDYERHFTPLEHALDWFEVDVVRLRCADGTLRWVSGRGRHGRDPYRRREFSVITLRDVTHQVLAEQELADSEMRLRLVLENQADVTARLDPDGLIEWVTPSVFDLVGWHASEVVGHNVADFMHIADVEQLDDVSETVNSGMPTDVEVRVTTISGDYKWIAAKGQPLFDRDGTITGSVINIRDITAEHEIRTQLTRSEEQFRAAMVSAPIGMAVIDLDRRFVAVNPALAVMTGYSEEWLLAHHSYDILDTSDHPVGQRVAPAVLQHDVVQAPREIRLRRADGGVVWVAHAVGVVRDHGGEAASLVATFVDVTESRATKEKLRYQATHDMLTNLVNRRDLYLRAERLQRRTKRTGEHVGVLYVDVDGFKTINDSHGHHVGDDALRVVAQRLTFVGRASDVVSRVGGDEFVVLLPDLHSLDDAAAIAEKMLTALREPVMTSAGELDLRVSIGVTLSVPGESVDEALARADLALYQAKANGGNRSATWGHSATT